MFLQFFMPAWIFVGLNIYPREKYASHKGSLHLLFRFPFPPWDQFVNNKPPALHCHIFSKFSRDWVTLLCETGEPSVWAPAGSFFALFFCMSLYMYFLEAEEDCKSELAKKKFHYFEIREEKLEVTEICSLHHIVEECSRLGNGGVIFHCIWSD